MSLLIAGQFARRPVYGSEKPLHPLFVVREASKCGYIDITGRLAIQMAFDDCLDFSGGYAPVEMSGKWGFINETRKLTIQPSFDQCRWSFSEGFAVAVQKHKYGFIDSSGGFVFGPKYDLAFPFEGGLAPVSYGQWQKADMGSFWPAYDGEWRYLDEGGKEVWKPSRSSQRE